MALTHADVRRILEILDRAQFLESLEVRLGDFVLQARKQGAGARLSALQPHGAVLEQATPVIAPAPRGDQAPISPPVAEPIEVPAGMLAIRSPMVGSFFLTPKPGEPPFVKEGSKVEPGATVCLVEVMKMFNTVVSPVAGRVHRIAAVHGTLVQHDQVLMIIEPETNA